jgi:hypothetical protein
MSRKVKLVATARQYYAGRLLLPGDKFHATEAEAADLCAIHFAERAQVAALLETKRELKPEVENEEVNQSRRRGTYRRRDMEAEK